MTYRALQETSRRQSLGIPTADLSSKLANQATDPGRVDYWLSYAADAHLHLGDMLQQQQKYSDATVEYRAGLVIASRLNADDPGNTKFLEHLSLGYGKLGDALIETNDIDEAISDINSNINLTDGLVKDLSANIRFLLYQEWSHFRRGVRSWRSNAMTMRTENLRPTSRVSKGCAGAIRTIPARCLTPPTRTNGSEMRSGCNIK